MKEKTKSALIAMLTFALISATAVAFTWAAVVGNKMEDSKTNTFAAPNASVQIAEDRFDGENWSGTKATESGGKITLPISGGTITKSELGEEKAKAYTMGMTIPKNPMLKNNLTAVGANVTNGTVTNASSLTTEEWLAMKVTYSIYAKDVYTITSGNAATAASPTGTDATTGYVELTNKAAFTTAIAELTGGSVVTDTLNTFALYSTVNDENGKAIGGDAGKDSAADNKWLAKDETYEVFYYPVKVPAGRYTNPLFENVVINTGISPTTATLNGVSETFYSINVNGDSYYFKGLPQFKIELKGYAVQADGVKWKDGLNYPAKAALDSLIG